MKFTKIETRDQINQLKKDDILIVNWGSFITPYEIHGLIANNEELLLHKKKNHYFIIDMFLNGTSNAKEVYLVEKD